MPVRTFQVSTPVRRHFQDTLEYCGAACAQMAIAAQQGTIVDQGALYGLVAPTHPWRTSPADLAETLSRNLPVAYAAVSHGRSRSWVMRHLAWSMCHHGRPAMALVNDGGHWIVIEALIGTADDGARQEYQPVITEVLVRDPAPDLVNQREALSITATTPPPHDGGDLCADMFVEECYTASGWDDVFTRCGITGEWDGRWVGVCVPRDTPSVTPADTSPSPPATPGTGGTPIGSYEFRRPAVERWDAGSLVAAAREGLQASGLRTRPAWMEAVGSATGGWVRLVHHLDRGDAYYLLVLTAEHGRGRLIVRLDASSGQVLHAALDPAPKVVEHLFGLPDTDRLVWAPCAEAHSPFFPMVERTGTTRPDYRLTSGRVVPRLTPLGPRPWR